VPSAKYLLAVLHQFRNRMPTIPYPFLENGRNQSHCLGLIKLYTSRESFLRNKSNLNEFFGVLFVFLNSLSLTEIRRLTWWRRTLASSRGRRCMFLFWYISGV
jgi:hypothetical protein